MICSHTFGDEMLNQMNIKLGLSLKDTIKGWEKRTTDKELENILAGVYQRIQDLLGGVPDER